MEEKILALLQRFWNDVAGLPWQDKHWTGNLALREQSKNHFVTSTANDILEVIKGGENADNSSNNQVS